MRKFFVFTLILMLSEISFGSVPETKIFNKQKDLMNGHLNGISISEEGELFLGLTSKKFFDSERPFIWDLVADPNGNLFLATGDRARIFQIDPSGKTSIVAQWDDVEVYALAMDANGKLYAGTSPNGKIYRLEKNNSPRLFAELNVKYIWDILFDSQNNCYVATGDSGTIYSIDRQGKVSVYYQSSETHIRCLAWDSKQQLLAGSYKNGYLYRFDARKNPFVIFDSEFQEIHQICVAANGTIYASALGQAESEAISRKGEKEKDASSQSLDKMIDMLSTASKSGESQRLSPSGIIKIQPDGVIKNIWELEADQVQSIFLDREQSLLVGTANNGRLFKISPREETTYLLKFDDSQIVAFASIQAERFWLATSNLGKIYYLEPKFLNAGSYESEVVDARTQSNWGSIKWEQQVPASSALKFSTRSGNTEKPNSTWSQWSSPYQQNEGDQITSPRARFLQWKLELSTSRSSESPRVKNIKITYLQQNLPPEIFSIMIHAVESKTKSQPTQSAEPSISIMVDDDLDSRQSKEMVQPSMRRPLRDGYREATWQAMDENNDQLVYSLFFQQKKGKDWWLLKTDLTRPTYTWDSRMMPDGIYRMKVVASDEKSNPINTTRQAEKISDWFTIDNTAPKIESALMKRISPDSVQISFRVNDDLSPIKQVQFSYDIQKWQWVYPLDLVCDSKREDFQFRIKLKGIEFYSIVIKATDEAENSGFGRLSTEE